MNKEKIENYYEYDEFMKKEDLAEELQPYYTNNDCCSYIVKLRKEKTDLQQENQQLKSVFDEIREYIENNSHYYSMDDGGIGFVIEEDNEEKFCNDLLQILDKAKESK